MSATVNSSRNFPDLELQPQLVTDRTVRTVGGDQPIGSDPFGAPVAAQDRVDAVGVLRVSRYQPTALDASAEFLQSITQDLLGQVLRQHQQIRVRRVQPSEVELGDAMFLGQDYELAQRQASGNGLVDHPKALEELQRPGLQAKRFGADVVVRGRVHASHIDAAPA